MKSHSIRFALACLLYLSSVSSAGAQGPTTGAGSAPGISGARPEERLVILAYKKFAAFNKASLFEVTGGDNQAPEAKLALTFELRNFRTGPIQEIKDSRYVDLVTLPTGQIIRGTHTTSKINGGEEQVSYRAKWTNGQYASAYDPRWTIGDLFHFEPKKYFDVGGYVSYEVTASFDGRTRTYKALALFHNPYGSSVKLKPEFWDTIVGMGGSITQLVNERRPPLGRKRNSPDGKAVAVDDYDKIQADVEALLDVSAQAVQAKLSYSLASRNTDPRRPGNDPSIRRNLFVKANYRGSNLAYSAGTQYPQQEPVQEPVVEPDPGTGESYSTTDSASSGGCQANPTGFGLRFSGIATASSIMLQVVTWGPPDSLPSVRTLLRLSSVALFQSVASSGMIVGQ